MPGCDFSLTVFILGAGRSSRMGRPKLLLPWAGSTVVGHLIQCWEQAGADQTCMVIAGGDQALGNELDRLNFPVANRILNPAPDRGMFSSIQCAADWFARAGVGSHCAVALGDQPQLRVGTLKGLLAWAREHDCCVCQPKYAGRPRHPVLLPASCFVQLASSRAETLKEALFQWPVSLCDCDDIGLSLDLDTPEDYRAARLLTGNDPEAATGS